MISMEFVQVTMTPTVDNRFYKKRLLLILAPPPQYTNDAENVLCDSREGVHLK
jgi:hypothetical protein